jgi:hypothetical protein
MSRKTWKNNIRFLKGKSFIIQSEMFTIYCTVNIINNHGETTRYCTVASSSEECKKISNIDYFISWNKPKKLEIRYTVRDVF